MSPIHILLGLGALALLVLGLRKKKEPELFDPDKLLYGYEDDPPDGSAPPPDIEQQDQDRPPHDLRQTWEHLTEAGRQAALTTPASRKADLPYIEALVLAARDKMESGQLPYQMQQTLQDGSWSVGLLNLATTSVKRDRTPEEDVSDVFVKWRSQGMPTIGHSPVQRARSTALSAAGKAAAQATPAGRKADLTTITKLVQVARSYAYNNFLGGNRTAPTTGLVDHFTKQGYSGAVAGLVERNITLGRIIKDDVNAAIVDWQKAGMPSVGTPVEGAPYLVLPADMIVHAPLVSPAPGGGGAGGPPIVTGDPTVDRAIADAGGAATEEGKKLLEGAKLPDLSGGGPPLPPAKQDDATFLVNLAASALATSRILSIENIRKLLEKGPATSHAVDIALAAIQEPRGTQDQVREVANHALRIWAERGRQAVRK